MSAERFVVSALSLSLAACAGGYQNNQPFNVWLNQLDRECTYAAIGAQQVGRLIENAGSNEGTYFIDQLERMFNHRITPPRFASDVSSFLQGRESDPGIECVIARLPPDRPKPQIY